MMMRLKMDTVSKGLYALVAVAVLPALFIILYSGFLARSESLDEATQRLGVVLNIVAQMQHEKSQQTRHLLEALARLPEVRTMDLPTCAKTFAGMLAFYPDLSNITLLDARGVLVAGARPVPAGRDVSDRTAFQEALRTRDFSAGDYTVSRVLKIPIMQFSLPVLDDRGNITGVLFATHDLSRYRAYLQNVDLHPESRFLLIDRDGLILADRTWNQETTRIGERVVQENWSRILDSRDDRGTFTGQRFDDKRSLYGFVKLRLRRGERPYMVVMVNVPSDVVLAGANRAMALNLGLLALAAALALVVAKFLGRTFVGRHVEALRGSEKRYRHVVETAMEGVWILDAEGRTTFANRAMAAMLGREPGDMAGVRFLEHALVGETPRDDGPTPAEGIHERTLRRTDGSQLFALVSTKLVSDDQGALSGAVSMVSDITERARAERSLVEAERQAVAANAAKNVFLANMSHEIRTPLNGILGTLQLLETTPLDDEQREYVRHSLRSTKRLTRLLADILDLTKIEAGTLDLHETTFALADVKESLFELFALAAEEKHLTLEFVIAPDVPAVLVGDHVRLHQILFNLVGNAIKFTARGGVRVDVIPLLPDPRIGPRVLFVVADTGIGISDDLLATICEPFVQAENSFTRRFQGAGLGLSIVRKLVELMHGSLDIDNTQDRGTAVYLSVPFKPA